MIKLPRVTNSILPDELAAMRVRHQGNADMLRVIDAYETIRARLSRSPRAKPRPVIREDGVLFPSLTAAVRADMPHATPQQVNAGATHLALAIRSHHRWHGYRYADAPRREVVEMKAETKVYRPRTRALW